MLSLSVGLLVGGWERPAHAWREVPRREDLIPHSSLCEEVLATPRAKMLWHFGFGTANESKLGKCSGLRLSAPARNDPRPGAHLVSRLHQLTITSTDWLPGRFVSDYSSATASDSHGVPFHDLLSIVDSQRTVSAIGCPFARGKRFVRVSWLPEMAWTRIGQGSIVFGNRLVER